ncbi:MAG: hypothetical protein EA392_09835 [Cryomorphaceae bacterium]|nr:MAG: hypothetical protein EA392_09835 [Cryomorphaceae bacterium]
MNFIVPDFSLMSFPNNFAKASEQQQDELKLLFQLMAKVGVFSIFSKEDLHELLFRTVLLTHCNSTGNKETEGQFLVKGTVNGKAVSLALGKLQNFVGLSAKEGYMGSTERADFTRDLKQNELSADEKDDAMMILSESLERKIDKVHIVREMSMGEVSEAVIQGAEDMAQQIMEKYDPAIFSNFLNTHSSALGDLEKRAALRNSIVFQIEHVPFEIVEKCIQFLRGDEYDKEKLRNLDREEFIIEFVLIELAWAVANGLVEISIHEPFEWVSESYAFDVTNYDGLQTDEETSGGINLWLTYDGYELAELEPMLKGIEMPRKN